MKSLNIYHPLLYIKNNLKLFLFCKVEACNSAHFTEYIKSNFVLLRPKQGEQEGRMEYNGKPSTPRSQKLHRSAHSQGKAPNRYPLGNSVNVNKAD